MSARALYVTFMDRDFPDSLEVISNLLYLIRLTLHDPAAASSYVDLAEQRVRTIALKMRLSAVLTPSSAVHDESARQQTRQALDRQDTQGGLLS
jgi:hypothetical protein